MHGTLVMVAKATASAAMQVGGPLSSCCLLLLVVCLQGPDVSCMCYDDVNNVVWTGHRNGGIRWAAG